MSKTISNLSEYLEAIKSCQFSTGKVQFAQSNVYYRGEANVEWKLQPPVFRVSESKEHYDEFKLIKEATAKSWSLIHSTDSYLERLILFQHYGLKTRLYDITSNPLVALYFAVSGEPTKNGRVLYGYCDKNYNNNIAELIAKIISTTEKESMGGPTFYVKQWLESLKLGNELDLASLEENLCKPRYVFPPLNSPRITAQNGAFLMAPLLAIHDVLTYRTEFEFSQGEEDSFFESEELIIESENKPSILEELRTIGIDEGSMYPELEHIMRTVNSNCTVPELDV